MEQQQKLQQYTFEINNKEREREQEDEEDIKRHT